MTNKAPPLLEPYLALPREASLLVLSGVLCASTNWLVLRHVAALLGTTPAPSDEAPAVLLVSFMRDFAFWRDGAARLGIDLGSLTRKNRFLFVDGTTLFLPAARSSASHQLIWNEDGVAGILSIIRLALSDLRAAASPGKVVLIVDQPDFLLAATGAQTTVTEVHDMLLDLAEQAHSTIVTIAADEPLVSQRRAPLEREQASLALSLAHGADAVLALRLLDTGAAGDVSGIVRITRGGIDGIGDTIEEHEYLYRVGGDGGVRVFERGQ